MTFLRTSVAIAWKELQIILKDRGQLAVLFLLPLLMSALFTMANQGSADEETGLTIEVFAVSEDKGELGQQVLDALDDLPMLDIVRLDSIEEADQRVGEGERIAAITVPADFSAQIEAYEPTAVNVVVDPVQQDIGGIVTGLTNFAVAPVDIQGELLHGVRSFLEDSGLLEGASPEMQRGMEAQILGTIMTQLQSLATDPPITVRGDELVAEEEQEDINLFELFMPAFSVMFAFFLTGTVGQTFHKERDEGTFRRLLASPLSRAALVAGPTLAYMVIVTLQMVFLFAVGSGLFGMRLGSAPHGLLLVSLALGLVVAGLGLLIGTVTRTGNQADTMGSLLAFVLPFVGGIFIFGSLTPGYMTDTFMGDIAPFLPHMHAAEGYRLIMTGDGTPGLVLVRVGYLLIFAVIFFLLARWRLRFD